MARATFRFPGSMDGFRQHVCIEITAEQNVLTISAKYNEENKEEKENYHLRERKCGQVSRSFRLDATADTENVSANLTNGILTLRIPTKPEAKPKKIDVK
ncbi:MAG: Hsp20/alpha crystallin family protein [Planctomycetota bacterium]